jgi:hypothetical protein
VRFSVFKTAAALSAAAFLLSACSNQPQNGFAGLPPSGAAPSYFGLTPSSDRAAHPALANILNSLLVSDVGHNGVEVLRSVGWTNRGQITDGLNGPNGNWVDKNGSLYVANYSYPSNVTEYNSNGKLVFTYPGQDLTIAVATDGNGNVYEAAGSGYVSEYAQGINEPTAMCRSEGPANGIAVDKSHDVFVSVFAGEAVGRIIEFEGGLEFSHCNFRTLPISVSYPTGMVFDKQGRLIVCDFEGGVVDIIPHPYTAITGTLGGSQFFKPFSITINRAGTQAYVSDTGLSRIFVLAYPSGSDIATLGGGQNLLDPTAAVSSRNYIP